MARMRWKDLVLHQLETDCRIACTSEGPLELCLAATLLTWCRALSVDDVFLDDVWQLKSLMAGN
eukprot:m.102609 g.102609  ORF g.102609 m.102609 type:complete len:64 (-) comp16824_c0_seq4:88-279(-)